MYIEDIRAFSGRNIYSHHPCVLMRLNLQKWAGISTDMVPAFKDKLVKIIPELKEHHCSLGRPGGFVERMEEGTFFGHVIEHTAIELQRKLGYPLNFGKTRGTDDPKIYQVIYSFDVKEVGFGAGYIAVNLVKNILEDNNYPLKKKLKELAGVAEKYDYGPSTKAIINAARKINIPVIALKEGTSLIQLGTGIHQKRLNSTISCETRCMAVDLAGDKGMCKNLLEEAGIPVPRGATVGSIKEALELVDSIGYPVVLKPHNGNHGRGVTLNVDGKKDLVEAFKEASVYSSRVVVEQQIDGQNYRLLVVGGRLVAASKRVPPFVLGNGVSSIKELIQKLNCEPTRGEGHEKPLTRIKLDSHILRVLKKKGMDLKSVPSYGEKVTLRDNGNLSTGGYAEDVSDKVHPENKYIAERAAKILGLDIAGVDIISKDISMPLFENYGSIIEINAAPGIRMHEHPSIGKPRKAGEAIVNMLFPPGAKARIPVISITGTNGKTTVTRMVSHLLKQKGLTVGMASTDGIYINDRRIIRGDTTGPISAQTILKDSSVEAAVLETARGGIIRGGLGYDCCDIAVITNISHDHLGQDGINDIEDLLYVKSLVAEAVKPGGYVILNADDVNVVDISRWAASEVIYFSKKSSNIILKRHLADGGKAVFIKGGAIYTAEDHRIKFLVKVTDLPVTLKGKASHHTENALAAASVGRAFGLSRKNIVKGLKTFSLSLDHNPGRGNVFDYGSFKVIVDYGHNEAGFLSAAEMGRKIGARRMVGVVGVPGDRSDELIKKAGAAAGRVFDCIYIKEDQSLRGREKGEVASLLEKGIKEAGSKIKPEVILKEEDALITALKRVEEGDIVIVFYERLEPILKILQKTGEVVSLSQPEAKRKKHLAGRAI
ncbi:cyanophycin synthetase [Candidatus Contubernalis alkaliaceticus]|uniref:cyanophycin synthetase n=1 Tax=Candidatus Contubernalis alkaliaceticus TaxID=338645 RepID=UPI001F4BD9FF|nr:cyanophycin synthetase [Candidatus Contubernalis alkalaceticus]UNC90692.1 cyanophycin synthetase [Candidatus Contubernalis alkalaceticus]